GIAFYLMLLDQYSFGTNIGEDPATTAVWFSPKVVSERYNLSDDTRSKGMNELVDLGIVTVQRRAINPNDFDIERVRNTYTLDTNKIKNKPARKNTKLSSSPRRSPKKASGNG
ncbi:MAG: hypothetical protein ABWX68_08220, partial [Arthrobacter sp.]|uniref:hypothetical protein n=1 Tax=Arthrobacter sp. TaxID=1667 RepID=UPI0034958F2C